MDNIAVITIRMGFGSEDEVISFDAYNNMMKLQERIAEQEISSQYNEYELIESIKDIPNQRFLYKYRTNEQRKI